MTSSRTPGILEGKCQVYGHSVTADHEYGSGDGILGSVRRTHVILVCGRVTEDGNDA